MSRILKLLMALVLIFISPSTWTDEKDDSSVQDEERRLEVAVDQIEEEDHFDPIVYGGFVEAQHKRSVISEIDGMLMTLSAKIGERVGKGVPLFALKPLGLGQQFQTYRVNSPIAGTVTGVMKEEGASVERGSVIMEIADTEVLKSTIHVTYDDVMDIQNLGEGEAIVGYDKTDQGVLTAKVAAVSHAADRSTSTYPVEVTFQCQNKQNCKERFRIGSPLKVKFKKNQRKAILIPLSTLHESKSVVFTLDQNSHIQKVSVRLGRQYGDRVEIVDGLQAGVRLVTKFNEYPRPNEKALTVFAGKALGRQKRIESSNPHF